MGFRVVSTFVLGALIVALPAAAGAQIVGTFSWQTQPYCNVVTVQVIQQGALFQLAGADDLCGAGLAPVTGTAVPAGASVVFGMTTALPTGRSAHLSATISLSALSGTWSDADGNTGAFAFGAHAIGPARPAPAGASAITVNQFAPTVYSGTGAATTLARSDHDHDARYYTRTESDAASPETVITNGINGGTGPFVHDGVVTVLAETFTTTRPGRLLITKMLANFAVNCTGATDGRVVFLRVDGLALKTSAHYSSTASIGSERLVGVTDVVVPAGVHTVDVATQCLGLSVGTSVAYTAISNAGIVVLP